MKKNYLKQPMQILFCFTLLLGFQNLFSQAPSPGTMEFGGTLTVLSNSTNPSVDSSFDPLLNNFDVSGVSSNSRFIAFANTGNGGGTSAIGDAGDHVLVWTGDSLGTFTSGTMSSNDGSEFGITAMEFAYEFSSTPSLLDFTIQGKKDNSIVGTILLSSPAHNTEINIDFTNPTTGSFADIDEIVILPASPIVGGFSVDEMVIVAAVSNTDPTISIDNSILSYIEGNTATQIDALGTINDADGDADWNGGTLTAQITANAEATDEISISDTDGDGTAITVSGTNILANGTDIGDLSTSGGIVTNGTILTITFDSDATNTNVQEVLQSLRYRTTSTSPGTSNRTITITANDTNAGTANDTRTVSVSTVPNTTSVNVPFNGTYIASQNLDFTINFDENIIVNTTGGTPQLALTIGSTLRQANYVGGSGSSNLAFRYTVQSGDVDSDGITVGSLSANGGTLQNGIGTNANLTLNSIGNTTSILVNAPIQLTITGLTGGNKEYDNSTAASASGTATLVGVEIGDDVSLGGSPTFTFASVNVGTGITINTTGYTISGTDSGKYTLTQPTLSGNITTKELTITGLTGGNKTYDDSTAASASGTATLVGVEIGDDVSLGGSPTFTFASANAGAAITINTTGYTISGTDSGNYTLTQPTLSGNINQAELTVVGLTGDNKVYDNSTAASASGTAVLAGILGPDVVNIGGSPVFTFASSNVGTGITINTTGYNISGTDSGNYTLTQPTLSADITTKELTITGLTGDNKVFDGTTIASATGTATLVGVETGDDVTLGGSPVFTFASSNVGTGITINTSGYSISGTDSGNYSLTQPTLSADITTASITWTGATNNDWNTASNWNTNSIPVTSSEVTIPNSLTNYPTITSAVTVNSINIASGASLIANASVTGSTTYTRNLPTTNWYLVSSPVSGETQQDVIANHTFASGSGSNIGIGAYTNNGAAPWTYATTSTTGPLVSGAGVSMKLATAGNVSITGTINSSNVSFPIATGTRNNFNLIGNPFTAFVNSSNFTADNTGLLSEETVWLWDGSQYVTYNVISPIELAPSQAFFVEANGSGNITFSTTNQSHQTSDTFMRQISHPSFELFVENATDKKSTKVFYVDNKTKGFDNGYDSKMFSGVNVNFGVFTELLENNQGKKLAIQTLPNSNYDTMIVPVGVIANANEQITFSVNGKNLPTGIEIYLEDKLNNSIVNLTEGDHTLTLKSSSNSTGRFYIHTTAKRLSNEEILNNFSNINIYKSASQELTINGLQGKASIKVFSILGKEVNKTVINSNGNSKINLPELPSGVYIVKLTSDLGKLTKKIILE
ncbi:YDG domain-containing protein [Tenacibaculum sp. ZS6-P6]|uniref:YDG domain-containing protein n=1 Tax=Tenacibaculum sp. ZS6-P6 TaxID=3447503 RepID=UPI003F9D1EC2